MKKLAVFWTLCTVFSFAHSLSGNPTQTELQELPSCNFYKTTDTTIFPLVSGITDIVQGTVLFGLALSVAILIRQLKIDVAPDENSPLNRRQELLIPAWISNAVIAAGVFSLLKSSCNMLERVAVARAWSYQIAQLQDHVASIQNCTV